MSRKNYEKNTQNVLIIKKASPLRACLSLLNPVKNRRFKAFSAVIIMALSIITTSGVGVLFASQPASAATASSMSLSDQALSYAYLNGLRLCVKDGYAGLREWSGGAEGIRFTGAQAQSGEWFQSNTAYDMWVGHPTHASASWINTGIVNVSDNQGKAMCNAIVKAATTLWGYADPLDLLCSFVSYRWGGESGGSSCKTGSDDFGADETTGEAVANKLYEAVKAKVYGGQTPSLQMNIPDYGSGYPARYLYYQSAFDGGCSPVESSTASADYKYTVTRVDAAGKKNDVTYEGKKNDTKLLVYTDRDNLNQLERTCKQIAEEMNTYANDYSAYRAANSDEPETPTGDTTETGSLSEGQSTCVVEGIGWIVCPVTNFLAGIADASYGLVKNFLVVDTSVYDSSSGTYTAWSVFRNIANIAFVIVFLIIIFSQLTGQGINNYGIKKTLPRLVVAAILVNISFFICQIAVDLSQILGVAIKDALAAIPIGTGASSGEEPWGSLLENILMGTGIAAIAIGGGAALVAITGLSISLPVLLAGLLAILMTVVILMGRQAAIVILIVISPLAFIAFMLPNTEQWFKKWYKVFIALLMVFPIIALLYGGGELTSRIISSASASAEAAPKFWLGIVAIAVASIPLIMTPSILKSSLNGLGSVGTKLSGMASKANARIGSAANTTSRYGDAKQGLKNRFALGRANRRANSKMQQGIDNSRLGRAIGLDKGSSRASAIVNDEFEKQVKDSANRQSTESLDTLTKIASSGQHNGKKVSDASRAAAVDKVMASGSFSQRNQVLGAMASDKSKKNTALRSRAVSAAYAKGDANIYGTSFGDKIVQSEGSINSAEDLTAHAVENVSKGSLSAEHLVQGEGSADYLIKSVRENGDAAAIANITAAAKTAKTNPSLIPKVTSAIDSSFSQLGPGAQPDAPTTTNTPTPSNQGGTPVLDNSQNTPAPSTPGTPSTTPPTTTTTPPPAATTPPTLTTAQAAQQTAQQAAQGTAGSSPFAVSGGGTVIANTAQGRALSNAAVAAQGTSGDEGFIAISRSGEATLPEAPGRAAGGNGSTVNENGQQTPNGATEDYHDGMSS